MNDESELVRRLYEESQDNPDDLRWQAAFRIEELEKMLENTNRQNKRLSSPGDAWTPDVFVNFTDGGEGENYVGVGMFVRHEAEESISYGEPHCTVKISPDDVGSLFPTRCVKFLNGGSDGFQD